MTDAQLYMSPIFLIASLFLSQQANAVPKCVEILDAGLLPVIKNHIGIHFFLTVFNRGPGATEVEVSMVQCCEDFPGSTTDCSSFHLIPETRVMEANTTRNFTLIHPTLYPHDRRGECLLGMRYTTSCNRTKEARQHIAFDTSLTQDNVKCQILQGFPGYVVDWPPCRSHDEDALNKCKMVDCHMKYFGRKSFFNRGSRVCEPVPACLPSKRRGMPDVVYDVTTNQCRDLGCAPTQDDLQHLMHADLEPECVAGSDGKMPYLDCHRGQMSNVTGDCQCEAGYQLAPMPEEPGNPRTQIFHSCNVDDSCWRWHRLLVDPPDKYVLALSILLALAVVVVAIGLLGED